VPRGLRAKRWSLPVGFAKRGERAANTARQADEGDEAKVEAFVKQEARAYSESVKARGYTSGVWRMREVKVGRRWELDL